VSGRNSYEVAGRDEALRVLDGLAKESGTQGDLAALLGEASLKLTTDWRPPFRPDGLILLRRILVRAESVMNDEPAITPSQMRRLLESVELGFYVDVEEEVELDFQLDLEEAVELEFAASPVDNSEAARDEEDLSPDESDPSEEADGSV
jgi:hypothetical protein